MDLRASGSFSITSIMSSLLSAILEWILIFMIFVDSSFAYLVTRFARRSQLQTPCLLCSRLDHFLGNQREEFYWDLICHNHKSKISSLVLCQLHNNLVDVHRMCESCVSSFATINKSDENPDSRECSCCNEEWVSRTSVQNLFDKKSIGNKRSDFDASPSQLGQLPHVEYSQIKVNSDTESDGPFSENESLIRHLDSPVKIPISESKDRTFTNHGLDELDWKKGDHDDDVSKSSELASSRDVHPSPIVESNETNATITPELEKEASNPGLDSTNEIPDSKPHKTETNSQKIESLDLGDAYKLALGTKGRQLSGRLLEQQRSITESTRASQDLKLLLSQLSFTMSPREDSGLQIFQRRISLERNESNLSIDGSSVSEIEGESELDRLKRQVEHDKKMLVNLCKELEEERSASAIATNQAMAMITRLQEEKAAFHMEALQCVRMMEEQAEYDTEALQKANDVVLEKEKQIQEFEYELEMYRSQFGDGPLLNGPRPESETKMPDVPLR